MGTYRSYFKNWEFGKIFALKFYQAKPASKQLPIYIIGCNAVG
jgi:hypothetical protein